MLSPRFVGAVARRAGLSPPHCDAPISRRPVCLLQRTFTPFGSLALGGFSRVPADGLFLQFLNFETQDLSSSGELPTGLSGRIRDPRASHNNSLVCEAPIRRPGPKTI